VEDIAELLQGRKSRDWIRRSFIPSKRIRIGRDIAWRERDILDAFDRNELTK
jgi:hypothetical protein